MIYSEHTNSNVSRRSNKFDTNSVKTANLLWLGVEVGTSKKLNRSKPVVGNLAGLFDRVVDSSKIKPRLFSSIGTG